MNYEAFILNILKYILKQIIIGAMLRKSLSREG